MPEIWDPAPIDPQAVAFDGETGVLRNRLEIVFKSTASAADLDRVVSSVDGNLVAAVQGVAAIVIEIADPGTLQALEAVRLDLQQDPSVWSVNRSEFAASRALPSTEAATGTHPSIRNHLAIRSHGAWNARAAMTSQPTIIVVDHFGDGPPQGWDAELVEADFFQLDFATKTARETVDDRGFFVSSGPSRAPVEPPTRIHGYFVGGVAAASFGGNSSPTGLATGIYSKTASVRIADVTGLGKTAAEYRSLQLAQASAGKSVINNSLGWACEGSNSPDCQQAARIRGGQWATKVRQAGLESRTLILVAAGNTDGTTPYPFMETSHYIIAAGVRQDLVMKMATIFRR